MGPWSFDVRVVGRNGCLGGADVGDDEDDGGAGLTRRASLPLRAKQIRAHLDTAAPPPAGLHPLAAAPASPHRRTPPAPSAGLPFCEGDFKGPSLLFSTPSSFSAQGWSSLLFRRRLREWSWVTRSSAISAAVFSTLCFLTTDVPGLHLGGGLPWSRSLCSGASRRREPFSLHRAPLSCQHRHRGAPRHS